MSQQSRINHSAPMIRIFNNIQLNQVRGHIDGGICRQWTSFIGQFVHPVGGKGWNKGGG